jgi:hypothetical protein
MHVCQATHVPNRTLHGTVLLVLSTDANALPALLAWAAYKLLPAAPRGNTVVMCILLQLLVYQTMDGVGALCLLRSCSIWEDTSPSCCAQPRGASTLVATTAAGVQYSFVWLTRVDT